MFKRNIAISSRANNGELDTRSGSNTGLADSPTHLAKMNLCELRLRFRGSLAALLPLVSNMVDILPCSCLEIRQLGTSLSPLSINPFTYISRTVPEFDPTGFAEGKKGHGVEIDESHLFEINEGSGLFASEQFPKRV